MNSRSRRWLKVLLLGCALGVTLVGADVALWLLLPESWLPTRLRAQQPFRLSADPDKHELLEVVNSQLSAFRRNDYAAAYTYADSTMRARVSVTAFEQMVKTGYPFIAHSRSVSFGIIVDNGAQALVNVGIIGNSGRRMIQYRYLLRHEPGGWRISGVMRIPHEGITV